MKVAVKSQYAEDVIPVLKEFGVQVCSTSPDLIVAYGGDGTLLMAEREFPSVPKLPIRDNKNSALCRKHSLRKTIESLVSGKLIKSRLAKIEGVFNDNKVVALNDLFIHNINRIAAIRCSVWINGEQYLKEDANDAIGISTPHGSTAYFRSITNCIFTSGIGLAFSNSRDHSSHIVVSDDSKIRIKVTRGPALLVADNSEKNFNLDTGSELIIRKSSEYAEIYALKEFMCPACRALRHMKI